MNEILDKHRDNLKNKIAVVKIIKSNILLRIFKFIIVILHDAFNYCFIFTLIVREIEYLNKTLLNLLKPHVILIFSFKFDCVMK